MRSVNVFLLFFLFCSAPVGAQAAGIPGARQTSPEVPAPYPRAVAHAERREDAAALTLLRPLAEQGHAQAGLLLGKMHAYGWGVPQSRDEGLAWVRRAASAADAEGQAFVALSFLFADDFPGYDESEAVRWFRAAAEGGSARGAFGLGLMHKHGRGVPRDLNEAARWFRAAAADGVAPAHAMLATLHEDPASPLHDPAEAARRYRAAADAGGAELLYAWGEAYEGGPEQWYPVPVAPQEAARLYRRAAELGYAEARTRLAALTARNPCEPNRSECRNR